MKQLIVTTGISLFLTFVLLSAEAVASQQVNESREMTANGRLQFTSVTGEFEIVSHDENRLVVTGTLGENVRELVIEEQNGGWHVKIEHENRQSSRSTSRSASRLTLKVPRSAEIDAGTVSGSLTLRELDGRRITLRSVSGNIQLDQVLPERLEARTVSGSLNIAQGGSVSNELHAVSGNIEARGLAGQVNVNSVSGAVRLQGCDISQLSVETVSGQVGATIEPAQSANLRMSSHSAGIELILPKDTAFNLRARTFSGRITNEFDGGRQSSDVLSQRVQGATVEVNVQSFSGNVRIRQQNGS